jgi:hypothetical protein
MRNWFFNRISKIHKSLAKVTKRRKGKSKLTKLEIKGGYYSRQQQNSKEHIEIF